MLTNIFLYESNPLKKLRFKLDRLLESLQELSNRVMNSDLNKTLELYGKNSFKSLKHLIKDKSVREILSQSIYSFVQPYQDWSEVKKLALLPFMLLSLSANFCLMSFYFIARTVHLLFVVELLLYSILVKSLSGILKVLENLIKVRSLSDFKNIFSLKNLLIHSFMYLYSAFDICLEFGKALKSCAKISVWLAVNLIGIILMPLQAITKAIFTMLQLFKPKQARPVDKNATYLYHSPRFDDFYYTPKRDLAIDLKITQQLDASLYQKKGHRPTPRLR